MTQVAAGVAPEKAPRLSFVDEAELLAYFTASRPGAPGARSSFGAMCSRLATARNPRSKELPTPGTPWTQIAECRRPQGAPNFDGEDSMVMYVDARRRFRRVCERLSRLSPLEQDVLDAYYGSEQTQHPLGRLAGVDALTETARRRNRGRAARGLHEPVEATVRWLAAATAPEARSALGEMRREAAAMLQSAQDSYASARGPVARSR